MSSPHLYLVDGSSYIFRAYHRLPPLTNRHGLNVGAVYGYTTMLWKLAEEPAQGGRADAPGGDPRQVRSTHRNEMYGEYKANRPPPPPTSSRNSR
jgi:DNA polymerase-1